MPLQKPISRSISMSYCVRWRRRWDSSSLPSASSSAQRSLSSRAISCDRALDRALLDVVVRRRPDRDVLEVVGDQLAGERVEVLQALDLVAEQRRAEGRLLVGGEDLERLAAHAERAAAERRVVARVLDRDELAQQRVAVDDVALAQDLHVHLVGLGRAEAEDRADADATMITSRRANSAAVAAWRRRSTSSLIAESFSM